MQDGKYDWTRASPESRALAVRSLKDAKSKTTDEEWQGLALGMCRNLELATSDLKTLMAKGNEELVRHFGVPELSNGNWIESYLEYTANHEAPELFHYWCGITVLGAVTARKVWFDQHYYKLFPNLYVTLVAPAGRCRRSVATDISVRLLRHAEAITVVSEKGTPEGILKTLEAEYFDERSAIFIHAPELAVFLGKQQYNEGLIALLTTLYNCPDSFDFATRQAPKLQIENIFIAMLGATAPEWLTDAIPAIASSGGYLSRNLIITLQGTDRVVPFPQPFDPELHNSLARDLKLIGERKGAFSISLGARKWYTNWYTMARSSGPHPLLAGFQERKSDHLIRLAMILTLAQKRELLLEEDVFIDALHKLNQVEANLPNIINHIGGNMSAQVQDQVLSFIKYSGGQITGVKLMANFVGRLDRRTIMEALAMLQLARLVVREGENYEEVYCITDDGSARS